MYGKSPSSQRKDFLNGWSCALLHIKITHFDSITSVVITSVASVTFFSQGRKCHMLLTSVTSVREAYYHDAYVVPITTWEGHLKHLKHLIWKRRNESTGLQTFCHLKAPQKLRFWRGALPLTLSRSVDAPPYTIRERYKAPLALLRECYGFWKHWHPPKAY